MRHRVINALSLIFYLFILFSLGEGGEEKAMIVELRTQYINCTSNILPEWQFNAFLE